MTQRRWVSKFATHNNCQALSDDTDPSIRKNQQSEAATSSEQSICIITMVADMSYIAVSNVVESWEGIRRIKNYEEAAGVKLFRM